MADMPVVNVIDPFIFEAGGRVSIVDDAGNEVCVGTVTSVEMAFDGIVTPYLNVALDGALPRNLSGRLTAVPGPGLVPRPGRRVLERLPS